MDRPPPAPELRRLVGATPVSWRPLDGGYTRAGKWVVELDDGRSCFVKRADPIEAAVYAAVEAPFLPRVLGIGHDALVLEDLSRARWPPPYADGGERLLEVVEAVNATAPPPLPALPRESARWSGVAGHAEGLLALGLCDEDWLGLALPALAEAEARAELDGEGLVHGDLYSGNVCFAGRGPLLVDWGCARRGSAAVDTALAAGSIWVEDGIRLPLQDESALAALATGIWADGLLSPLPETIDPASALVADLASDLRAGLVWAADALGLPPPRRAG